MITIPPGPINPNGFAEVSHNHATTTVITITNDNGDVDTISVPPNTKVKWYPPAPGRRPGMGPATVGEH